MAEGGQGDDEDNHEWHEGDQILEDTTQQLHLRGTVACRHTRTVACRDTLRGIGRLLCGIPRSHVRWPACHCDTLRLNGPTAIWRRHLACPERVALEYGTAEHVKCELQVL